MKTKLLKNKEMSPEVYALRRKVIDLIYEAKKLVPSLPRIEVRVTENNSKYLGVGRMCGNIIWISERSVASRSVVFHEILHAVFATEHVKGCPLMDPVSQRISDKECDRLFIEYSRMKTFKKDEFYRPVVQF